MRKFPPSSSFYLYSHEASTAAQKVTTLSRERENWVLHVCVDVLYIICIYVQCSSLYVFIEVTSIKTPWRYHHIYVLSADNDFMHFYSRNLLLLFFFQYPLLCISQTLADDIILSVSQISNCYIMKDFRSTILFKF